MIQKSYEFQFSYSSFFFLFFQIQESGTNGFNGSKSNENILNNNATKQHTPNNIVKQKKPTTPTPTVTSKGQ